MLETKDERSTVTDYVFFGICMVARAELLARETKTAMGKAFN